MVSRARTPSGLMNLRVCRWILIPNSCVPITHCQRHKTILHLACRGLSGEKLAKLHGAFFRHMAVLREIGRNGDLSQFPSSDQKHAKHRVNLAHVRHSPNPTFPALPCRRIIDIRLYSRRGGRVFELMQVKEISHIPI